MGEEDIDADVIIIGAGPAGLSAATWCGELGLETIVFEKQAETGGQLLRIFNPVTNYLGLETTNGREMRDRFLRSFAKRRSALRLSARRRRDRPRDKVGGDRSWRAFYGTRFDNCHRCSASAIECSGRNSLCWQRDDRVRFKREGTSK